MKQKLLLATALVTGMAAVSAAGLGVATAATNHTTTGTSIVDKLATKFNLKKEDVQKVFDEDRASHEAEHQQKMSERIDQAVKDGKISQTLADQLKTKLKEIANLRDGLKDKTADERRTAMQEKMDEFKKWLEDNNIPKEIAGPGRHGMGMRMGPPPDEASNTSN